MGRQRISRQSEDNEIALEFGSSLAARKKDGLTAADIARNSGGDQIIEFFEDLR